MSGAVANPQPNPPQSSKRWLAIAGVGAVLLIGGSLYTVQQFRTRTPLLDQAAPVVPTTVSALGYLEPLGEIVQVAAPAGTAGARLEQLLVKPGDRVKAGQVLGVLDVQAKYQAAVAQAQSQVQMAEAQLTKVRSGAKSGDIRAQAAQVERLKLERADEMAAQRAKIVRIQANQQGEVAAQQATVARLAAEYRNAQADSDRFEQLYRRGAISASQWESARLKADTAQQQQREAVAMLRQIQTARQAEITEAQAILARIRSGQQQQIASAAASLDSVAQVRPVDVQIAQAEVAAAQANLRQAQAVLATAYIRAPQSGQVLKIHTQAGETIRSMGDTLGILDLGQTAQMVAVAEVYDSDVGKIQVGQSAIVRATPIDTVLTGTVNAVGYKVQRQNVINTDPTANIDARVVEVRVQLDPESSQKVAQLTNLQVEVSIDIQADDRTTGGKP